MIIFAPTSTSALQKVSASGGIPTAATTLGQGEVGHNRPFFLPDGRHFLYRGRLPAEFLEGPIYLASLDSVEAVELRDGRTVIAATDSEQVVRMLLELDPEANDLVVATASLADVLIATTHQEGVAA